LEGTVTPAQAKARLEELKVAGKKGTRTVLKRAIDAKWIDHLPTENLIGADGDVKSHRWRVVDFNFPLENHLREMLTRLAAGLPKFGFHDSRYLFISMCVTSGIDFMTVARWVGHRDWGVLIGRVSLGIPTIYRGWR
jgi:integrase